MKTKSFYVKCLTFRMEGRYSHLIDSAISLYNETRNQQLCRFWCFQNIFNRKTFIRTIQSKRIAELVKWIYFSSRGYIQRSRSIPNENPRRKVTLSQTWRVRTALVPENNCSDYNLQIHRCIDLSHTQQRSEIDETENVKIRCSLSSRQIA